VEALLLNFSAKLVSFVLEQVSNSTRGGIAAGFAGGPERDCFSDEFFPLKLSVSGTNEQVDGDATHLYIRWPLPDAGREAA
jgi:hypothetical protein